MKKILLKLLLSTTGAITLGIAGLVTFMNYGGNSCDQPPQNTCDCFCCHMFGLRGYESCAQFGMLTGVLLGAILGYLVAFLIWRKK